MPEGSDRQGGYDPEFFARLAAVEDRHFWFRARNSVIALLAAQAVAGWDAGYRVLEIGCGDGNVLRFLRKSCPDGLVVGMDLFPDGLALAKPRARCPMVQGDARRPPFRKSFQLIGLFDALEHVPDDSGVLSDVFKMLDAGGKLIVTVPAHKSLWSYFDEVSGHCRRYHRDDLRRKLIAAGYRLEYLSEYMGAVYPLMWVRRRLAASNGRSKLELLDRELRVNSVANAVLTWILRAEAQIVARRWRIPIGASLVAVAVKPDSAGYFGTRK